MLSIERLSVSHGEAEALMDISLQLADGELLAVIGPNGAGKTTLVNAIAGLLPSRAGKIWLDGEDMTKTWRSAATANRSAVDARRGWRAPMRCFRSWPSAVVRRREPCRADSSRWWRSHAP